MEMYVNYKPQGKVEAGYTMDMHYDDDVKCCEHVAKPEREYGK